ncbi:sensor histidine kinase [Leeuwenhoekiella sp. H156]|uniref:sensor histidine kinase n=1 Tax=Leeuwenhoekiella sp. H156 TaxID=3450128 RepID=UPI003FA41505
MKKVLPQVLLLLLIYFGIFFMIGSWEPSSFGNDLIIAKQNSSKLSDDNEALRIVDAIRSDSTKMKWEYVKERLFPEGYTPVVDRLNDSIILYTINASYADSIAILNVLDRVKRTIPQLKLTYKIDFDDFRSSSNYLNKNQTPLDESMFFIVFSDVKPDDKIGGTVLGSSRAYLSRNYEEGYTDREFTNTKSLYERVILELNYYFSEEPKPTQNVKYIEFGIFRLLSQIQTNYQATLEGGNGDLLYEAQLNQRLNDSLINNDIFLFKKLYSDDFQEQFEEYIYDAYPLRYSINFLNKEKAKVLAIFIVSFLGVFIMLISISIFYNRNFKYKIFNYVLPLFVFFQFYFLLFQLFKFLTNINTLFDYKQNLIQHLSLILIGVSSGVLLYLIEKLVKIWSFFVLKLILKVFTTLFVLILPVIVIGILNRSFEEFYTLSFFSAYLGPVIVLSLGRGVLIYLNHYSENLVKEKDLELSALREANTNSQLRLLQAQINPHFLYNSLNSIAGLAHKDADKTERMALSLSDLFRYTVGQKKSNTASIAEEVDMVERYLEIEKIRFGDRLDFIIEVDPDLKNLEIPRFILQPLVENAIKHGTSKLKEKGIIRLSICSIKDNIILSVYDNGPDFPDGLFSGHGLQSVSDLLKLNYGETASLNWENLPQKKIEIRLPKTLKNE